MVVATGELRLNESQLVGTQATLGELRLNEPQIVGTQATLGELRLNEPQIRIFTLAQMHFFCPVHSALHAAFAWHWV